VISADWDFQKIHDEYRPRVMRYLTRLVGEFEAEDLTQEVFIRVSKALPSYRGEARLATWIYRIAANAAIDRLRQQASWKEPAALDIEDCSMEIDFEDFNVWTGEPSPSLEQLVFTKEGFDCLCDFLADLPDTYRLVVALNQIGEYTAREIAEILGLSIDVVKIRLHRGKVILLQALKMHCKPEDWL
jgi:RNA polymerase sigma-70 factor (ECF subfamily)